jgi:hypothetical protein
VGDDVQRAMLIKKKIGGAEKGASAIPESLLGERKTNPNFDFVYHVMNITCIDMRP